MAEGGGSSCLRHYDALRTKIDVRLSTYTIQYSRIFLSITKNLVITAISSQPQSDLISVLF